MATKTVKLAFNVFGLLIALTVLVACVSSMTRTTDAVSGRFETATIVAEDIPTPSATPTPAP